MDSNTVAAIFINIIFLALFAAFVFGKNEAEQNLRLKLENRLFNLEKMLRKLESMQETIESEVEIKIDARIAQFSDGLELIKTTQKDIKQINERALQAEKKVNALQKQLIDKKILGAEVKSLFVQ
jgi:exonuclease VII small subunit